MAQREGWRNTYERINGVLVQVDVMPRKDMRRHKRGRSCWCEPTEERLTDGVMYGHHAADGRDLVETQGVN